MLERDNIKRLIELMQTEFTLHQMRFIHSLQEEYEAIINTEKRRIAALKGYYKRNFVQVKSSNR